MLKLFIIQKVGISLKFQVGMWQGKFLHISFTFYAIIKNDKKQMMDYYVGKKLEYVRVDYN